MHAVSPVEDECPFYSTLNRELPTPNSQADRVLYSPIARGAARPWRPAMTRVPIFKDGCAHETPDCQRPTPTNGASRRAGCRAGGDVDRCSKPPGPDVRARPALGAGAAEQVGDR